MYGNAGDRWPVQVGDVWQAGPHTLACLDLETPLAERFYASVNRVAMVYSDPPWSTGNAKCFRTKAGLGSDGVTLERLWSRILELMLPRLGQGDLYLEIGSQHRDDVAAWLAHRGRAVTETWPIVYYRKHPCWLLRSRLTPRSESGSPEGLDDTKTPAWAVSASTSDGDLVCDPCTGRGLTAVAAHQSGRRFVGTELHPRRLAVALDRLHKLGLTPRRIGAV